MTLCPACRGNSFTKHECTVCHGSGEVCSTCNGAGLVLNGSELAGDAKRLIPCPACRPGQALGPRAASKPPKRKRWNHYAD